MSSPLPEVLRVRGRRGVAQSQLDRRRAGFDLVFLFDSSYSSVFTGAFIPSSSFLPRCQRRGSSRALWLGRKPGGRPCLCGSFFFSIVDLEHVFAVVVSSFFRRRLSERAAFDFDLGLEAKSLVLASKSRRSLRPFPYRYFSRFGLSVWLGLDEAVATKPPPEN